MASSVTPGRESLRVPVRGGEVEGWKLVLWALPPPIQPSRIYKSSRWGREHIRVNTFVTAKRDSRE